MSPSHVRKGGRKYGYYLSCVLFHGAAERAGSARRVPAADIEALVIRSVREHLKPSQEIDDRSLVHTRVARVEVQPEQLIIQLAEAQGRDCQKVASNAALQVAWQKTISRRRRAILVPDGMLPQHARPIRSENRTTLVASIARGRRWLDELITEETATMAAPARVDQYRACQSLISPEAIAKLLMASSGMGETKYSASGSEAWRRLISSSAVC